MRISDWSSDVCSSDLGTHGVEGFCVSGAQIGHFRYRLFEAMPAGTRAVMIHAINPYGFAWLRRVTEDNVDLNRNFQDFSKPLPENRPYEEIHDFLIPDHWEGQGRAAADQGIMAFQQKNGAFARSEERRVGNDGASTCNTRGQQYN